MNTEGKGKVGKGSKDPPIRDEVGERVRGKKRRDETCPSSRRLLESGSRGCGDRKWS